MPHDLARHFENTRVAIAKALYEHEWGNELQEEDFPVWEALRTEDPYLKEAYLAKADVAINVFLDSIEAINHIIASLDISKLETDNGEKPPDGREQVP